MLLACLSVVIPLHKGLMSIRTAIACILHLFVGADLGVNYLENQLALPIETLEISFSISDDVL